MDADIGVLISETQLKKALRGRFGFEFLPFYTEAARNKGKTVIFFSDQLIISESSVYGFYWNRKNFTFSKGIFKLPAVIHNRLRSKKKMKEVLSKIDSTKVILFNSATKFNKWKVHRNLLQHSTTKAYLPATEKLKTKKQLSEWLNTYGTIYLKPRSGSLGKGVIRLKKEKDYMELTSTKNRKHVTEKITVNSLTDVFQTVSANYYMIQEGISIISLDERPIDFRISVQKGEMGTWTISGVVAKMGNKKSHAANLAVGGKAISAMTILNTIFEQDNALSIYEDLKNTALQIAAKIEQLAPFTADLGMDLAVTTEGKVKFIEVNGRDLRIAFKKANEQQMWKQTFYSPINYGVFLLGKIK
ncbi:YheC/YheD family endospore coat-associated protein [Niallia sp. 01092]|uniref:YheC/YheD family endospore coat-associated protein n=1 Tax=unclassified Niallia TaxID=2837522 RepID=UPI003FD5AB1A